MKVSGRDNAPLIDREIIDSQDDHLSIHTHRIRLKQDHLPYKPAAGKRLASEKHFSVYADQIVLDSKLENPGKNIELNAREIIIEKPALLDVTGADGHPPDDPPIQEDVTPGAAGTNGFDATSGDAGGKILISAHHITNKTANQQVLSTTDISKLGPSVVTEHKPKITDTVAIPKIKIGSMKYYGNHEIDIMLEEVRIEGLSKLELVSVNFDASQNLLSLKFKISKLVITGKSMMSGSQRTASSAFAYQLNVSAVIGDSKTPETSGSLVVENAISFNVMMGSGVLPPTTVKSVGEHILKALQQHSFAGISEGFSKQMNSAAIILLAAGGAGGRGQDGLPGVTGEPGADGVNGKVGYVTQSGPGFPEEAMGDTGGPGGRPGSPGHSGDGGTGGNIELNIMQPPTAIFFYNTAGGAGGIEGSPGARGQGGPGGKGGLTHMYDIKTGKPEGDMRATDGGQGGLGPPATFKGNQGATGSAGPEIHFNGKPFNSKTWPGYSYADLAPHLSLSQLLMTQNATDLEFLNAKKEEDQHQVADGYTWLTNINQPFIDKNVTIDEKLVSKQEQGVRSSMHNSAVVSLMRLQQGLDFFGHSYNWTPVLNLKSLVSRTTEIISLGKVIEDQYNRYLDKGAKDKDRMEAFRKAKQEIDKKLEDILNEINRLKPQIDSFHTEVTDYTEDLRRQRHVLVEGELKFKDDLVKYLREQHNMDFGLFLDMIGTVISCVGGVAGAAGGIKTAINAVKKAEEFSKKVKNVVEVFKKAKAGFDQLKKAYKSIKDYIDDGNPNAAKIIADAEDFDKFLKEYTDKVPAASELRKAMDYYQQLAQARNMAAYNYTGLVAQVLSLQAQHDQLYQGIQHINAEIASHQDNLLPVYTAYMKDAYEDVQRNLLSNIYEETRAYEYWSLQSRQLETSNLNIATMTHTHQRLIKDIDSFRKDNESFSPFSKKITINADKFPNEFAAMLDSKSLAFGLDIHDELGFQNMRYIIAQSFELAFPDIDDGKDILSINLIHSGRAVLNRDAKLNKPGSVQVFSHRPRVRMYQIDYGDRENTAGGNFGEGGQGYIGLSPFSNWRIDFDLLGNDWLDLTKIKTVVLTFKGRFLGPGRSLA